MNSRRGGRGGGVKGRGLPRRPTMAEEAEQLAADRDAQIEAFLDQIEGETLGEMMNYLSAELQSNALHQFEVSNKGGDCDSAEEAKRREEDKIYDEMTKLTRSTVDR